MSIFQFLFVLTALLHRSYSQDGLQCYLAGECFGGDLSDETSADSYSECQTFCNEVDHDCQFSTFYSETNVCITFLTCPDITDESCTDCATSQVGCPTTVCNQPGECVGGDFVGSTTSSNSEQCLEVCVEDPNCSWYEYDTATGVCIQLSSCPGITNDDNCDTCFVGQVQCGGDEIGLGNMFVAGGSGNYDTELIDLNVQNTVQHPCFIPAPISEEHNEPVGTFSNGVPIICSGPYSRSCISYDNISDSWSSRGDLDRVRRFAAGVMLNEDEWWITGGDDDTGVTGTVNTGTATTIIYNTQTDVVTPYVDLPVSMWRHNLVKVDDDTYFVIGGSDEDASMAYMFDRRSETFEELPNDLTGTIYLSFAGLIQKADGTKEIVLTGGYRNATLTQIYNIESRAWRTSSDFFPDVNSGVSVPFGSTFLAVGGQITDVAPSTNGIYRFEPDTEEWIQVNRVLQYSRRWFSAMLVPFDFLPCF